MGTGLLNEMKRIGQNYVTIKQRLNRSKLMIDWLSVNTQKLIWITKVVNLIKTRSAVCTSGVDSKMDPFTRKTKMNEMKQFNRIRISQPLDITKWKEVAESECFEGVLKKFNQNPHLNECLQGTDQKLIVESSYDRTWGTGVPPTLTGCSE